MITDHAQRTAEWQQARLGHVTASRFADVMTNPRSKSERFSKTAESYMADLICEHLTQRPASEVETFAMRWGTEWEPVARELYEERTDSTVAQVGFVRHVTERFVGGSPDGIVPGKRRCIEIKCPLTPANHLRVLTSGSVPDEHFDQVQGVMWITGCEVCDFISFHPHFPPELRLLVVQIPRDDAYIAELSRKVLEFRDEMAGRLKTICNKWEAMK